MQWLEALKAFPPEMVTAVIAGSPILELRAGIPIGIQVLGMDPGWAFLWGVIGNSIASVLFLYSLRPVESLCVKRLPTCNLIVQRYFTRARHAFEGTHAKYGAFALAVFIAIPLPLTGAWTGAAAAHVLGLPKKVAIPSMICGITVAGIIMTLATLGLIKIF